MFKELARTHRQLGDLISLLFPPRQRKVTNFIEEVFANIEIFLFLLHAPRTARIYI
jgi:hypothetical protein